MSRVLSVRSPPASVNQSTITIEPTSRQSDAGVSPMTSQPLLSQTRQPVSNQSHDKMLNDLVFFSGWSTIGAAPYIISSPSSSFSWVRVIPRLLITCLLSSLHNTSGNKDVRSLQSKAEESERPLEMLLCASPTERRLCRLV